VKPGTKAAEGGRGRKPGRKSSGRKEKDVIERNGEEKKE